MVQMTIDQIERQEVKATLKGLQGYIYDLMIENPLFREISARNQLIRYVWDNHNPYENAESITRLQRKIIADNPQLDTKANITKRSNRETLYHEYFTT